MTEYISNCPDYLNIENPNIDKLIYSFLQIKICFAALDYNCSNKELFHVVYENSLYTLTFSNIMLMLQKEYGIESKPDFIHKNYTLVKSQDCSPLEKYISENISAYVEIVLSNCNGKISDREDIAISLLNNTEVAPDAKERYIDVLSTVITEITSIMDTDLWSIILDRKVLAFSESNFTKYFQIHGVNETLIGYLNNTSSEIDFKNISDSFGTEVAAELFDSIVVCNGISTGKYKKILTDLGFIFDSFDADKISADKFQILISERIIEMNIESLKFVREKYPEHLYTFIRRNLDKYLVQQTTEMFRLDEALQLITWDIDDEQKIGLLALTNTPISIVGKQYSDAVNTYILTHNFEENDEQYVYANYSQYGEGAKAAIVTLSEKVISTIASKAIKLDDKLLSVLLQSDTVSRNQKVLLFLNAIPGLNEDTCKKHFDELNLPDLKGIFAKSGGRRNYEKSDEVTNIFEALKANGLIYDYRDDERNSDKYIVIKNRPKK